jgi:hypothetical protein
MAGHEVRRRMSTSKIAAGRHATGVLSDELHPPLYFVRRRCAAEATTMDCEAGRLDGRHLLR